MKEDEGFIAQYHCAGTLGLVGILKHTFLEQTDLYFLVTNICRIVEPDSLPSLYEKRL